MTSLKGQIAVVTGASSGIGRALAIGLAAEGVNVFLAARRARALQEVAEAIGDNCQGAHAWVCPTDLRRGEDIEALAAIIRREAGAVNVLVHSGGAYSRGPMREVTLSGFDELYQANVRGPLLLTQAVAPFLERSKGQIVFVNSSAGISAAAGAGHFSATQHALRAVANAFRDELNAQGIRVLSVHLGRTATPRIQRVYEDESKPYSPHLLMQPEDVVAMILTALHLPRTAEVTELHMRPLTRSY